MAITYYEWHGFSIPSHIPSGIYTYEGDSITVIGAVNITHPIDDVGWCIVNLTGDVDSWRFDPAGEEWLNGSNELRSALTGDCIIYEVGLSGVAGLGDESDETPGRYYDYGLNFDTQTKTPVKGGYSFEPVSFTFDRSQGHGANVGITPTEENTTKLTPINNTEVIIGEETICDWEYNGTGAIKYSLTINYIHPIWGASFVGATITAPTTQRDVTAILETIAATGATECTWSIRNYIDGAYVNDPDPDWIILFQTPAKATDPSPEYAADSVKRDLTELTWEPGNDDVTKYDVYFGEEDNMVLVASDVPRGEEVFSIYDLLNPDPEEDTVYLDHETIYDWRVDSYVGGELIDGDVWFFITRSLATVTLTAPDNAAENTVLAFTLQWELDNREMEEGMYGDYFFVYLKEGSDDFTEDDLIANWVQESSRNIWGLKYNTLYYWQVQAGNVRADMIDSEVRYFTTMPFYPPAVSTDEEGNPTGLNNMVTIKRMVVAANDKVFYET